MTEDVRDLLPLYALGILEPDEVAAVERAIAQRAITSDELAAYQRTAEALVVPVVPSPDVKARLLASAGGGRFERFATRVGGLFDVALDRVRELLGLIERTVSWERQIPGVDLVHFAGGPAAVGADCGFVRIAPGAEFPPHTHVLDEAAIILAGTVRDNASGALYRAGDEYLLPGDSTHSLACIGDTPCIFAVRAAGGIRVGGVVVAPKLS